VISPLINPELLVAKEDFVATGGPIKAGTSTVKSL
jgi:hypothetical protein